jgi:hypothetical protein
VFDEAVRYDSAEGEQPERKRRVLYNVAAFVLIGIVVAALLEGVLHFPLFGVDDRTATASSNTTELRVRYPRVARGQLDTELQITVQRAGGFAQPITDEISADYLGLFTNQRPSPQPDSQTHNDDVVVSVFDPPDGDTLEIEWDLAARPRAWFISVVGTATVLDDNGQPDVSVSFTTDVRP